MIVPSRNPRINSSLSMKASSSTRVNLYGQPLEQCKEEGHGRGSWLADGTCTEEAGGVHQICASFDERTDDFSSVTGQTRWSEERRDKNHCVCLGAYALHSAKTLGDGKLNLKCSAIPASALSDKYVSKWSTWNKNELPGQIEDGVHALYRTCAAQAPDARGLGHLAGLVCALHRHHPGGFRSYPPELQCERAGAAFLQPRPTAE